MIYRIYGVQHIISVSALNQGLNGIYNPTHLRNKTLEIDSYAKVVGQCQACLSGCGAEIGSRRTIDGLMENQSRQEHRPTAIPLTSEPGSLNYSLVLHNISDSSSFDIFFLHNGDRLPTAADTPVATASTTRNHRTSDQPSTRAIAPATASICLTRRPSARDLPQTSTEQVRRGSATYVIGPYKPILELALIDSIR
jgi:hypothetical protein